MFQVNCFHASRVTALAGSNPTPQFRSLLLQAMYHDALSVDVLVHHCHGPIERSDDAFFRSLPLEITTFNEAFAVCKMSDIIIIPLIISY
jgi:hypothetical protein